MTNTINSVRIGALRRGITRLCHFTPSRNLGHIAMDRKGILASKHLRENEKTIFNPTDLDRLDGYPNHVCCSIQYPNAWYFRIARSKERLFRDWVVLLIEAHYLWRTGVMFCPRNAAAGYGRHVGEGVRAFEGLFAETVEGRRAFGRNPFHPAFLPTDEQAEVLIPDHIERRDVMSIAVHDEAQAKREVARLSLLGRSPPSIVVVPEFFDPRRLSNMLRNGKIPAEHEHEPGASDV